MGRCTNRAGGSATKPSLPKMCRVCGNVFVNQFVKGVWGRGKVKMGCGGKLQKRNGGCVWGLPGAAVRARSELGRPCGKATMYAGTEGSGPSLGMVGAECGSHRE